MSWEKIKFLDLYQESSRNGIYKSKDAHGTGCKIVNMGEIFAYDFISGQDMQRISMTQEELVKSGLQENDLLFARRSLVESGAGKVSIVCKLDEPTTFESSIIRVRLDTEKCYPLFYLYWMRSLAGRAAINSIVTGLNVKGIRGSDLKEIDVDYPPIDTQHRIADILSAYDDLIENNQKQIKLLEEAAQRLYKEWFVDLHFPGWKNTTIIDGVPEGWCWCTLDDVIEFDPKVKLTKDRLKESVPMSALSTTSMILNQSEFDETYSNSGSKFQNGDTLLARITPCLENGKTAFVWGLMSEEGAVGSTEYIVMRSKKINPYMVYLIARTDKFRNYAINSMTGSDGRQRVKSDILKGLDYLCPPNHLIDRFREVAEPIFSKIFMLNKQCEMAQEARDRLLPKLMSGELEV